MLDLQLYAVWRRPESEDGEGEEETLFLWQKDGGQERAIEDGDDKIGLARGLMSFATTEFGPTTIQMVKSARSIWLYQQPEPAFVVLAIVSKAATAAPRPAKTAGKRPKEGDPRSAREVDGLLETSLRLLYEDFRLRFGSLGLVLEMQGLEQVKTYLARFMPRALQDWRLPKPSSPLVTEYRRAQLGKTTQARIADLVKQLAFIEHRHDGESQEPITTPDKLMSRIFIMNLDREIIRTPNEYLVGPNEIPVIVRLLQSLHATPPVAKEPEVGPSSVLSKAALTNIPWDLGMRSLWTKSNQAWAGTRPDKGAPTDSTEDAEKPSSYKGLGQMAYAIPIHLEERYIMSTIRNAGLVAAMFHADGEFLSVSDRARAWQEKVVAPWLSQIAETLEGSSSAESSKSTASA